MAEEISNKTLAVIVVAAIVVTLGSTALILRMGTPVITGMATSETGTAQFNISEVVSIKLLDDNDVVDWGAGAVDPGVDFAVLDTEGTVLNSTIQVFDTETEGLVIQNDGNVDLMINVSSSKTATEFPGGNANRDFEWKTDAFTVNGRSGAAQCAALGTYTDVTVTNQTACVNLTYDDSADEMELNLRVVVPSDAYPEQKQTEITFYAGKAP